MDTQKVAHLLEEEEGFKLDFKYTLKLETDSDKKELTKDVIAMANTEGGRGYILFGVEDKTKQVVGMGDIPANSEERIQQIIASRVMPPVPIQFDLLTIDTKQVGVLTIFQSKNVPHQMIQNGVFYIRRGSTTDVANRNEIAKMLQYGGLLSFEMVPCWRASLDELDFEMMNEKLPYTIKQTRDNVYLLAALGVIAENPQGKGYCPTYGGLLLFGKMPQLFLPQATLELRINGKHEQLKGNILTLLKTFEQRISPYFAKTYPIAGLYEVVANALIHRDYWNSTYNTCVSISDQYVVVQNPSCYYEERGGKTPVRHNGWLYSRLLLLQSPEQVFHFGIGLEKVKMMFKGTACMAVKYSQQSGSFQVVLPGTYYKEEEVE